MKGKNTQVCTTLRLFSIEMHIRISQKEKVITAKTSELVVRNYEKFGYGINPQICKPPDQSSVLSNIYVLFATLLHDMQK